LSRGVDDPPLPERDAELGVDELPRARDAVHYIADRRILAACERRQRQQPFPEPSLRIYLREPRTHLSPEEWRTGFLAVHERFIPPELEHDLKQNAPQALLRDLYRPVREEKWVEPEVLVTLDPAARGALAEARQMRRLEPLEYVSPIANRVAEEQARRRAFVSTRWEPLYRDDEERPKVRVWLNE
jgi:hypothetical protein